MLATALYLPDPGSIARRISDLDVYLDTPVLIKALGHNGQAQAQAALELISLLREIGASMRCFTHTLLECQRLLSACASAMRHPQHDVELQNLLIEHAHREGLGASSLDLAANQCESHLNELGIQVRDMPNFTGRGAINEEDLENELQKYVHYARPETRRHDCQSLIGISRLRNGNHQRNLETAKAILVTDNFRLAKASATFFHETTDRFTVPACALDSVMATIAWLKKPVAAPELPRKQIIADCYAALQPKATLWRKYMQAIDRKRDDNSITEESYGSSPDKWCMTTTTPTVNLDSN